MGSLSQDTVLQEVFLCESFPQSFMNYCSSSLWGLWWSHKSCLQTCLRCGLICPQGHRPLDPSPVKVYHSFLQASTWLSIGCRWISSSLCICMGCRGRPVSTWHSPWADRESRYWHLQHFLSVLAVTLVLKGLFLSDILSSLLAEVDGFFILLFYPRGGTTVADGLNLGQQQVCLGAGWHWLHWIQR